MNQNNAKRCGLQLAASDDVDVITFTDVVDVNWDAGISTNAMLLHQGDELTLRQVVWGTRLLLHQLHLLDSMDTLSQPTSHNLRHNVLMISIKWVRENTPPIPGWWIECLVFSDKGNNLRHRGPM